MRALVLASLAAACAEPLTLPDDPAEAGVAVGTRTLTLGGQTVDVWYPAAGEARAESPVALADYLPAAFVDALAPSPLPTWTQDATPDARPRRLDAPVPVVVFSHGFGGFRAQSTQLCAHLASRGYLVLSADHPGRDLATLSPCILTVEGTTCSLAGFGNDPAVEDVTALLDALGDLPDDLLDLADTDTIGLFGHSAGGGTTGTVASADDRIDAALPLGGASDVTRDIPSAVIGGTCDAIVPPDRLAAAAATTRDGYWDLVGAGHLAFSDLCLADLGGLADIVQALPEANTAFLGPLRSLATDGCPGAVPELEDPSCDGAFTPLSDTDPDLRAAVTAFFDLALKAEGDGLVAGRWATLAGPE